MITIKSNVRDYSVHFEDEFGFFSRLDKNSERLYVVDSNVWEFYSQTLLKGLPSNNVVVFPVDEERKCIQSVMELYDCFIERSAKKNMTLIALGGGIIQDITGFVASTLYRGINWIFIPTTMLAQADSCIGSKTSLNYRGYKNLVGTFYPPSEVYIHVPFLMTLKQADFMSGLGEVIKLHIMGGSEKTRQLVRLIHDILRRDQEALSTSIKNSLEIKLSYMEGDEYDNGRRNLLNYGHCFGHALETVSNYEIPHGEAVVIGMLFANMAARNRGLLSGEICIQLAKDLLLAATISPLKDAYFNAAKILEAMKKDKKRTGEGLVLVMIDNDFKLAKFTDFTIQELDTGLEELKMTLLNR